MTDDVLDRLERALAESSEECGYAAEGIIESLPALIAVARAADRIDGWNTDSRDFAALTAALDALKALDAI
jgi:hypothetical protein